MKLINLSATTNIAMLALLATLTVCSNSASSEDILEPTNTNNKKMQYTVVTLEDGRKIECIEYKPGLRAQSISCNWSVATPASVSHSSAASTSLSQ